MSHATIESPVAASQLFFAWFEQSSAGIAPVPKVKSKTVTPAATVAAAPASKKESKEEEPQLRSADCGVHSQAAKVNPAQTSYTQDHLSFTSDGRIARPVRMGSVMIKLLKRYGITDAEIAEGVASYARKHQCSIAS